MILHALWRVACWLIWGGVRVLHAGVRLRRWLRVAKAARSLR